MVSFAVKQFGGMVPRDDPRMLPDNMAEHAVNCDLNSGVIRGLPVPQLVQDFSVTDPSAQRAYRLPAPTTGHPDAWLPLPSPYSSVVRSPLTNDTEHRIYWTNPGDPVPWWNTYARIIAGSPPWNLGIVQPTVRPVVTASGGTAGVPKVDRSYTYTFVNQFGEESAPALPSVVKAGFPDATWLVSDIPNAVPSNPAGVNYPPPVSVNIYRTVTGATTGAAFFFVVNVAFGSLGSGYTDTTEDDLITNNNNLLSTNWANPPTGLDGLTELPGGMLVGFTTNTIHFCEADQPHAWPAEYDQSLQYDILGMTVWQQSLMIITSGYPVTGSGNAPANFTLAVVRAPEPAIARGSLITDLLSSYYASQNGLIQLNAFGMMNQTLTLMDKNTWLTDFLASKIVACRHRSQYLAINGTGMGFLIDYSESRLGFMDLNTFSDAVCVWNDEYTGDAYIIAGAKVYKWDAPAVPLLTYRWRSKRFYLPAPVSLGAVQVSSDVSISTPVSATTPPLNTADPLLALPAGVNAVFRLYAGANLKLIVSKNLTDPESIFKLPSGFKTFQYQFEIVSRVPVFSVQLATTMKELKNV